MSQERETHNSIQTPTDFPYTSAPSVGVRFTAARLHYGLEIRDVARHLMLNPAIVQAIENDEFAQLGPPVFVRGYLSRYASLLNLPEQAVLEQFRQQAANKIQDPPPLHVSPLPRQTRVRDLRGWMYLMVAASVGWTVIQNLPELALDKPTGQRPGTESSIRSHAAIQEEQEVRTPYPFQTMPEHDKQTETSTTAATVGTPTVVHVPSTPLLEKGATPNTTHSSAQASNNPQDVLVPTVTVTPETSLQDQMTAFSVRTSSTESTSNGEARLSLEFSNDCWVEIKDAAGTVLVSGLMRANTTHTLSGPAPFKVTLGNAPAARLILNDRLVDTTLYVPRRGTVSRFTLNRD